MLTDLNDPQLDLAKEGYERCAFASSEGDARNGRWTEIAIWWHPAFAIDPPAGKPVGPKWIAEVIGCSSNEGEVDRIRRKGSDQLAVALNLIDERSKLGEAAADAAREFRNRKLREREEAEKPPAPGASDEDMLEWLFGAQTAPKDMADALGVSRRTVERALENPNHPGDLRVPLASMLRYLDRSAMRKAVNRA